jgi:hypothetical protein
MAVGRPRIQSPILTTEACYSWDNLGDRRTVGHDVVHVDGSPSRDVEMKVTQVAMVTSGMGVIRRDESWDCLCHTCTTVKHPACGERNSRVRKNSESEDS